MRVLVTGHNGYIGSVLTPTLLGTDVIMALPNVILGALAAGIAYGRWQLAPLKRR